VSVEQFLGPVNVDGREGIHEEEDRAWGWVVGNAPDEESALSLARELVGASDERWVNRGVAGDEYVDYLQRR
jgi:hypothetical protein